MRKVEDNPVKNLWQLVLMLPFLGSLQRHALVMASGKANDHEGWPSQVGNG